MAAAAKAVVISLLVMLIIHHRVLLYYLVRHRPLQMIIIIHHHPLIHSHHRQQVNVTNHFGIMFTIQRLQVVASCKTVSGVIESIKVERDGDYHIRLKMDPQFANLVNSANVNGQLGDLVVEPICQNPVSQQDAISSCQDFHQDISVPQVGTHVKVTGSYVLDNEHGGWAEIHPVTSISDSSDDTVFA